MYNNIFNQLLVFPDRSFQHKYSTKNKRNSYFTDELVNLRLELMNGFQDIWKMKLSIPNKWQIISTIYKLFEYNFSWNRLEFSDKMDLAIQMRTFNCVKTLSPNLFEIWKQILHFSDDVGHKAKASICSTIQKIQFCIAIIFRHLSPTS